MAFEPSRAGNDPAQIVAAATRTSPGVSADNACVAADDLRDVLDVEGPVRGEIFLVWLNGDRIELTGPDGPTPWLVQLDDVEHPVEAVDRILRGTVGPPLLVHSTSWRREGPAVVLSFLAVIGVDQVGGMASGSIDRADLARSGATHAPARIGHEQVLEHALRHLAWLAEDDEVVASHLSAAWRHALAAYVPEPFRNLP
jgi:hypothetical protein